ncbi:MAG: four helix bundle protein [Flavobacteriales bacterium CG03_land_8_20_14_0_80_35_15]|nr:MAG: four helix bundle protein [Flavobacteriaceae bacterium CG1_02_35_72]PIV17285.1 MAG: four helix bundle protein [Flavobacteriales bacterium CG03_land_8_20_14_0_80_35_15]PIX05786.1 MAG: four helix bundle protein [Flavobacteriales bacterium CG_4_8_14_3_um_filter_35_10]PJA04891.1 MAG: four helix bundle protein [Flavobacteriales bacterium CG_4_10_14_0_2_um_filter_35_18]
MQFTNNPKYKENIILKLTFEFAVSIVKYSEVLDKARKFSIANQILRSGTSIGANVKESQNAESKKDFIHKLKIALKEADELEYWLFLCNEIESYPSSSNLLEKLIEIKKILNKIVTSSK